MPMRRNCEARYSAATNSSWVPLPRPCRASLARSRPMTLSDVSCKIEGCYIYPQKTMRNSHGTGRATREGNLAVGVLLFIATSISFLAGCSVGPSGRAEFVYVAVPEASLRDRVATIYTKTGLVHNGERLQVLERMQNKRFVRVRTPHGEEGWLQERFLSDQQTYDQFARLAEQFRGSPAQASATIDQQVNVHALPGRKN